MEKLVHQYMYVGGTARNSLNRSQGTCECALFFGFLCCRILDLETRRRMVFVLLSNVQRHDNTFGLHESELFSYMIHIRICRLVEQKNFYELLKRVTSLIDTSIRRQIIVIFVVELSSKLNASLKNHNLIHF